MAPDADEERFAAFYRTAYLPVLRFTVRRVSRERAEDLVSEAFIVAWRRFDDVPDEEHRAIAWTLAVVRNLLLNEGRAEVRRRALVVRLAGEAWVAEPAGAQTGHPASDAVAQIWDRLRAEDQEVLALTYWDELTSADAATVLGISPVAVRLRLTRARRHLRRHLDLTIPQRSTAPIHTLRSTT